MHEDDPNEDINNEEVQKTLLLIGLLIDQLPEAVERMAQAVEMLSSKESRARRADFSRKLARNFRMAPKRLQHVIDAFARAAEREQ